jgi:flagellar L-ring protein precursor FlgH
MTTNLPSLISNVPVVGDMASRILTKIFSLTGTAAGETTNDNSREAAGSASQDLTGTITVTVIEVLPNGNLLVSGEKQVSLNTSNEVIRFSGVVNPVTITSANTVQSTQVADARLEYKGAGEMNEFVNDTRTLGFLGRFFLSVLPF